MALKENKIELAKILIEKGVDLEYFKPIIIVIIQMKG